MLLKSAELIGWALGGIEREISTTRERLAVLTAQANQMRAKLGRRASSIASGVVDAGERVGRRRRRRKMSPEAKKRISEMMRKRWAEAKKRGRTRL